MIIWKKNLKKSPSCIISLEHWLPIWISNILLRAIRPEAAGIKKRKSSQKRDDGRRFEIERWTKVISWFDGQEKEIGKNQKKNHLFTILNPYYHQQIFWHHQTIGENQRSVSVVSFFGPNVEPSSLLPRPKTATPVVPSSRKNSKNEKFVSDCDHYPLLFFSSSSLSHFFLKIITTFSFALLISRSVLFSSPPCFHASEMADRFSSSP